MTMHLDTSVATNTATTYQTNHLNRRFPCISRRPPHHSSTILFHPLVVPALPFFQLSCQMFPVSSFRNLVRRPAIPKATIAGNLSQLRDVQYPRSLTKPLPQSNFTCSSHDLPLAPRESNNIYSPLAQQQQFFKRRTTLSSRR